MAYWTGMHKAKTGGEEKQKEATASGDGIA
jgi:hypothetical protein